MNERKIYLKTKEQLEKLHRKIKRLKKRNKREKKTEKQIDFLINNDFQKWTNSFARKSNLWDDKKQTLMGEKQSEKPSKVERCCGISP